VNDLFRVVARKRDGRLSNLRSVDRKSSAQTIETLTLKPMWFQLLVIFQLQLQLFFIFQLVTVLRTESEHISQSFFAVPVKQKWPTAQISTVWQQKDSLYSW